MQHADELLDFISWQEKIDELAKRYCKDENDRKLLNVETYDTTSEWDCLSTRLKPAGQYGDWIDVDDFRNLAERFLLAMELIKVMEENQNTDGELNGG